jgi:CheY-like chemotaxis protein
MPKVLVVDDSEVDRRMLGGVLQKEHAFEVDFAADGAKALEKMAEGSWDLVVADLIMPGMGGMQLVDAIRQRYPGVPVLIVTAGGSEVAAVEALKRGAASYVPKQAIAKILPRTVHELLALSTVTRIHEKLLESLADCVENFALENELPLLDSLVVHMMERLRQMWHMEMAERRSIGVALKEALTNALYHGNLELDPALRLKGSFQYDRLAQQRCQQEPYRSRRIRVKIEYRPDQIRFVVRDEGPGFDVRLLPGAEASQSGEEPLGRGIILMRSFMDEVSHNAAGNEVVMTKRRPP